eukprot:4314219-Pyramimonas_sp.AAC.1
MWCKAMWSASCMALTIRCNLGANFVWCELCKLWFKICGVRCVVQAMWGRLNIANTSCTLYGVSYVEHTVVQYMWCKICGTSYVVQEMWSKLCGAIHVV